MLPAPARGAVHLICRARCQVEDDGFIVAGWIVSQAHARPAAERDAGDAAEVRRIAMPAERGARAVFGDERLLERLGREIHPCRDPGAERREERRRGRRLADLVRDEVIAESEIRDAPPRRVLLVLRLRQRELRDLGEERPLFLDGNEVQLENEPFRQRRRVAEELRLLCFHRARTATNATPSAAIANATASAVQTSTRRRRPSATCAACSSASTVFSSCAASSFTCADCCDTADWSSVICCCTRSV